MQFESVGQLLADIYDGKLDDELGRIRTAIERRSEEIKDTLFDRIKVGSLVRFNERTRPKYLQGTLATVTEKKQTRVVVKLGEDKGRFYKEMPITCYPETLDLLDIPVDE